MPAGNLAAAPPGAACGSRQQMAERLQAMWRNNIRVRALAYFTLGQKDLIIQGIDQKGLHRNEVGSKGGPSLETEGTTKASVVENHAHTRDRFTVMTMVISDAALASSQLHLEILFKSSAKNPQDAKCLKQMPAESMNVSYTIGPRGSYRLEHVLGYLTTALSPWRDPKADTDCERQREYTLHPLRETHPQRKERALLRTLAANAAASGY